MDHKVKLFHILNNTQNCTITCSTAQLRKEMLKVVPQEIYCDESGFSGNYLLDKHQAFFVYSSVAVRHEEAKNFVDELIKEFHVQNGELKSGKLIKYNRGRQLISKVIDRYGDLSYSAAFHKKYCLACKFFEYIFEPAIADNSLLFYKSNFHRFISNALYMNFASKAEYSEDIFIEFQKAMRTLDVEQLKLLTNNSDLPEISSILDQIRSFVKHNIEFISQELNELQSTGTGKWVLDLTNGALFSQLAEWGQQFDEIVVYCDASKPLDDNKEMFNVIIGKTKRVYNDLLGEPTPITFNLSDKIKTVSSLEYPGIQIADVIAGAVSYIFNNKGDELSQKWAKKLAGSISPQSVLPDDKHFDFSDFSVKRNSYILEELVRRSQENQPLLDNFGLFVDNLTFEMQNEFKVPI